MTGDDRPAADDPRHPLPASEEARHDALPETLVAGKGAGDDSAALIQPAGQPAMPDGETYELDVERGSDEPDGAPDGR